MIKKVYIIIVNYNGWQDTIECVESILKSTYTNYQIIIIDNDSKNDSIANLKLYLDDQINIWISKSHPLHKMFSHRIKKPIRYSFFDEEDKFINQRYGLEDTVLLVKANSNAGFSSGNNIALKYILKKQEDACIWLLNPDMIINNNSLVKLLTCADEHQKKIFGTIHKNYDKPDLTVLYGGWKVFKNLGVVRPILNKSSISSLDFISGGSLFTHIDNFIKVGLLPEEYFLYWEEADWCEQARRKGLDFRVCEESICYDKGSTSIGSGSNLAEYLYTLNSLRYAQKFYGRFNVLSITFFQIMKVFKRMASLNFTSARAVIDGIKNFYFGKKNEYKI